MSTPTKTMTPKNEVNRRKTVFGMLTKTRFFSLFHVTLIGCHGQIRLNLEIRKSDMFTKSGVLYRCYPQ